MLAALDTLAALYAERRLMVIALIVARRPSGLQLFSNAFRLRGGSGGTGKPGSAGGRG